MVYRVDKENNFIEVTILHHNIPFRGIAKCHPSDNFSEIRGCRYAEMRAKIKALKYDYKKEKEKCEECRKFVKAVSQYKNFNKEDASAKAMFRQLNRRINKVNSIVDEINHLLFTLNAQMDMQDKITAREKRKLTKTD